MDRVFRSKIDPWLVILIAATITLPLVIVALTAGGVPALGLGTWLTLGGSLAVVIGMPVWLFMSTSYTITPTELVVRCGPVTQRVPLSAITAVKPTRTVISAPALSLDRLAIDYGSGSSVIISPDDKEQFLNEMVQRGAARSAVYG